MQDIAEMFFDLMIVVLMLVMFVGGAFYLIRFQPNVANAAEPIIQQLRQ